MSVPGAGAAAMYGVPVTAQPGLLSSAGAGVSSGSNQKNDIFVGNLAFNTTEEQLNQAFSEIGRVLNVRLVTDLETGKPRGFAFIEFEDPQAALSAIRNMNDYELNGRRLRVNFSNSSHLEALAGKLGMDLSQQTQRSTNKTVPASSAGTSVVADALKGFSKGEAYDVIAKLKEIADRDPDEARRLISGHPQLPEALLFLMSNKLDMVKTPIATNEALVGLPSGMMTLAATPALAAAAAATPHVVLAAARAADPRARVDPRMAVNAGVPTPTAPVVVGPSTTTTTAAPPPPRVVDPRQRIDPRIKQEPQTVQPLPPSQQSQPLQQQQQQQPSAPQQQQQAPSLSRQAPPPVPPPPPPPPSIAMTQQQQHQPYVNHAPHLDPTLVQQVMSLTPQQIQQLPLDKQQSILQLRQQITGGHAM